MPTRVDFSRSSALLRRSETQPEQKFVHGDQRPSSALLCSGLTMLATTVNLPARVAPSPQIRARDTSLDGTTNGSAGINVDARINGASHLGGQRCGDHEDRGDSTDYRKLAEHKIVSQQGRSWQRRTNVWQRLTSPVRGAKRPRVAAIIVVPRSVDRVNLQDAASTCPKEEIDVASLLQTTEQDAMENRRVRDRRRAREGCCADCLNRRYRRFRHHSGGHVIVAVIVPQPRAPSRLNMPRLFAIGSASFRSSA